MADIGLSCCFLHAQCVMQKSGVRLYCGIARWLPHNMPACSITATRHNTWHAVAGQPAVQHKEDTATSRNCQVRVKPHCNKQELQYESSTVVSTKDNKDTDTAAAHSPPLAPPAPADPAASSLALTDTRGSAAGANNSDVFIPAVK